MDRNPYMYHRRRQSPSGPRGPRSPTQSQSQPQLAQTMPSTHASIPQSPSRQPEMLQTSRKSPLLAPVRRSQTESSQRIPPSEQAVAETEPSLHRQASISPSRSRSTRLADYRDREYPHAPPPARHRSRSPAGTPTVAASHSEVWQLGQPEQRQPPNISETQRDVAATAGQFAPLQSAPISAPARTPSVSSSRPEHSLSTQPEEQQHVSAHAIQREVAAITSEEAPLAPFQSSHIYYANPESAPCRLLPTPVHPPVAFTFELAPSRNEYFYTPPRTSSSDGSQQPAVLHPVLAPVPGTLYGIPNADFGLICSNPEQFDDSRRMPQEMTEDPSARAECGRGFIYASGVDYEGLRERPVEEMPSSPPVVEQFAVFEEGRERQGTIRQVIESEQEESSQLEVPGMWQSFSE